MGEEACCPRGWVGWGVERRRGGGGEGQAYPTRPQCGVFGGRNEEAFVRGNVVVDVQALVGLGQEDGEGDAWGRGGGRERTLVAGRRRRGGRRHVCGGVARAGCAHGLWCAVGVVWVGWVGLLLRVE